MDQQARRRRIRLLASGALGGGAAPLSVAFNAYVATLAPLLEYRMNITSGTAIVNRGSLGAPQDGVLTLGVGSLAQSSPLGAGEAITWDALDTKILVTAPATVYQAPALTWAFLHKVNGAGENNTGTFFQMSNSSAARCFTGATQTVSMQVAESTSGATSTTAASFLTLGVWQWLFATFDDAGDKKVHIYSGKTGAVTEASYGTQTAGVGTVAATTTSLNLGNRLANDSTFDGSFSRFLFFDKVLTAPQMLQLTTLAGLTA